MCDGEPCNINAGGVPSVIVRGDVYPHAAGYIPIRWRNRIVETTRPISAGQRNGLGNLIYVQSDGTGKLVDVEGYTTGDVAWRCGVSPHESIDEDRAADFESLALARSGGSPAPTTN